MVRILGLRRDHWKKEPLLINVSEPDTRVAKQKGSGSPSMRRAVDNTQFLTSESMQSTVANWKCMTCYESLWGITE